MKDCMLWGGQRMRSGYGVDRGQLTHRVAWEATFGPIPAGMVVCHRCDNPPCMNPDHLFVGTHADNVTDKSQKGRTPKGASHALAKLTAAEVSSIRAMLAADVSHSSIGKAFGVARQTITNIATGHRWRDS